MVHYRKYKLRKKYPRKRKRSFRAPSRAMVSKGFVQKTVEKVLRKQTEMKQVAGVAGVSVTDPYNATSCAILPNPAVGTASYERVGDYITLWRLNVHMYFYPETNMTTNYENPVKWWIVYSKDDYATTLTSLAWTEAGTVPTTDAELELSMPYRKGADNKIMASGSMYLNTYSGATWNTLRGAPHYIIKRSFKFKKGMRIEYSGSSHIAKFFRLYICSSGDTDLSTAARVVAQFKAFYTDA